MHIFFNQNIKNIIAKTLDNPERIFYNDNIKYRLY
nr:MAG TPA: hypothetical protein [Caudoviricetes sp.]DAW57485.1 MAG TPA: hypothetical protein [Caudoviricetes sp.]